MSLRYLLPCSCGNKAPVEPAQAGERVRCGCGVELEVPTLLGMKRLARAEVEPGFPQAGADAGASWGTRQRLVLCGVVVALVGIAMASWSFYTRPRIIDVDQYPPWAALQLWESLRMGVDVPMSPFEQAMFEAIDQHRRWTIVGLVIAVIGILMAVGSRWVGNRTPAKPRAS